MSIEAAKAAMEINNINKNVQRGALVEKFGKEATDAIMGTADVLDDIGTASATATTGVTGLGAALRGLWVSNPFLVIATGAIAAGLAIAGVVKAVDKYKQEQVASARESASALKEMETSMNDNISRVTELRTALDAGTLSEQEAYDAKTELLSIQQSLTDSYGAQAEGINLVNGSLDTQISKMQELVELEAEKFLLDQKEGIETAKTEMEKDNRHFYLGEASAWSDEGTRIKEIAEKYADKGLYLDNSLDGSTYTIHFKGDASDAEQVINDFSSDVRDLQNELGDDAFDVDSILSYSSAEYKSAKAILDEYQDLYTQALKDEVITDKTNYAGKTASEWLNNYSDAIEKYNNAILEGDQTAVNSVALNYKKMSSSLQKAMDGSDLSDYSALFEDITSQLDIAAIKAFEFNSALAGNDTTGYQTHLKELVDEIASLGMSDVDFKAAINAGTITSINSLSQAAETAGISTDELSNALVELGYISGSPEVAPEIESVIGSLSEIFENESYSTAIDDYKSKITSLREALDTLDAGEMDDTAITELYEQFPKLAEESDDLKGGIEDLIDTLNTDTGTMFDDIIEQMKLSGAEQSAIEAAERYKTALINSLNEIDISDIYADPIKEGIAEALDKENAGAGYETAQSYLKQAKEFYDKGLVGTDEFKEMARYFSPTGATDATNFAENYAKAARYLTEDSSGVQNFLKDLSAKTDDAGNALASFNSKTGEWTYNIKDVAQAAQDMGIGTEFLMDMFGRLEDYGAHNNFFSSVEEGEQHINDVVDKLTTAQMELAKLESQGANESALSAKRAEIEQYTQDLKDSQGLLNDFVASAGEREYEQAQNAIETIENMAEARKQALADGFSEDSDYIQKLDKSIQDFAKENEIEIDADFNVTDESKEKVKNILKDIYGKGTIENPLDRDFGSTGKSFENAEKYGQIVEKIQEQTVAGNEALASYFKTLGDFSKGQLEGINLFDGAYDSDALQPAEQALDGIMSTLQISKEEATQLVNVLADMGLIKINTDNSALGELDSWLDDTDAEKKVSITTEGDTSELDDLTEIPEETTTTVAVDVQDGDQLEEVVEKVKSVPENSTANFSFRVSNQEEADQLTEQIDAINDARDGEHQIEYTITVDDSEVNPDLLTNEEIEKVCRVTVEGGEQSVDSLLGMDDDTLSKILEIDSSQVDEARQKLVDLKNETAETTMTVKIDEGQFATLTTGKEIPVTATVDGTSVDEYTPEDKEATATYILNSDSVDSWNPPIKTGEAIYTPDFSNISSAPTIYGKAIYTSSIMNAIGKSTGTVLSPAKASGTAYNVLNTIPISSSFSAGSVALKKDERAVVNELPDGPESIIRDGVWRLIPGKMHMENLKKGDIILNSKQTKSLLKYGKTNSHARAYAEGTIPHISHFIANSYATGTGSGGLTFSGGASTSSPATTKTVSNTASKIESYAKQASNAVVSAAESAEDLKDWIQNLLDRLQRKTDNYIRNAENAIAVSSKLSNYNKAISNIDEQIAANKAGATRYTKQAKAVGLSSSLAKKVQNGTIDINMYSENVQEKITQYEKWWQLAVDCTEAVKDLTDQQKELAKAKIDSIVEKYELLANYAGARSSRNDAHLDYRETAGYSNVNSTQRAIYKDNIAMEEYTLAKNQNLANQLRNEIQVQLASGQVKKYDDAWRDAQIKLREFDEAVYQSKTTIEEMEQSIREIETTKLQRAFDTVVRWTNQLKGLLNLKGARDENVTESDYMQQVTANNNQILAKYALLQDSLEKQATYEYGSEKWEEEAEKIAEYKDSINELLTSNEELKDSIVEDRWEEFTSLQEEIDYTITELDYLRESLGASVDAVGNLTDDGQANIALLGQSIALEKQRVVDYNEALLKLHEDLENGNISQKEYTEKQQEFQGVIRDSISAMDDYHQELIDLYNEQIEAQNEVLLDDIDLWKKAREEKEEYFEYGKKLRDQTKEVDTLKAEIAALEGVTSASGKALLAKKKAELAEAEQTLSDTKREHKYDLEISGYDTLKENVQTQLDAVQTELEISSEMQQQVVDNMLTNIQTSYSDAYTTINNLIQNTGLSISSTTESAIAGLNSAVEAAKLATDAIKGIPQYNTSDTISNVDTSKIITDVGTDINGKTTTTTTAEKAASQISSTSNANTSKEASNTGTTSGVASSIKLNKTSLSLVAGKTAILTVTTTPENASTSLSWKSSSTSIATVSNGTVAAKKKGSATITVTDSKSGKKATCSVKVTAAAKTTSSKTKSTSSSSSIWSGIAKDASMKGNKSLDKNLSIVDRMKYYGYASDTKARTRLWKNLGGSGTYSSTYNQNVWLLSKLKKAGYAKGGIIDNYIPVDPMTFLGNAVYKNGDKGFITANPGEAILSEASVKTIVPAINALENFNEIQKNIKSQQPLIVNTELNFQIDQISNEIDLDKFASKLKSEVSKDIVREIKKLR